MTANKTRNQHTDVTQKKKKQFLYNIKVIKLEKTTPQFSANLEKFSDNY